MFYEQLCSQEMATGDVQTWLWGRGELVWQDCAQAQHGQHGPSLQHEQPSPGQRPSQQPSHQIPANPGSQGFNLVLMLVVRALILMTVCIRYLILPLPGQQVSQQGPPDTGGWMMCTSVIRLSTTTSHTRPATCFMPAWGATCHVPKGCQGTQISHAFKTHAC